MYSSKNSYIKTYIIEFYIPLAYSFYICFLTSIKYYLAHLNHFYLAFRKIIYLAFRG